jgi:GxxExxY protein
LALAFLLIRGLRALRGLIFFSQKEGETTESAKATDKTKQKKSGVVSVVELIHRELSEQIIGAGMTVLKVLKPGLSEKIYENALVLEFIKRGIRFEQQKRFPVFYEGHLVGTLIPDLIVNESVIVDAKVVSGFCDAHIATMLGYLSITDYKLALLLNFKNPTLEWKRVVR